MFLDLLLILFLTLHPFQSAQQQLGPQRIDYRSLGIKTTAKSAIVIDEKSGKILSEKNIHQVLPIASLTKLMTAMVFLDLPARWEESITIEFQDQAEGARLFVKPGEKVRIKDLFYSMLVGSANNATKVLVRSTGLSEKEFVRQMNIKAQGWGLKNTHFVEPTGLSPKNVASAYEMALLAKEAFKKEKIKEAIVIEKYIFKTIGKEIQHTIKNTDRLLGSFLNATDSSASSFCKKCGTASGFKVTAGKTGYLEEADYCLASEVKKNDQRAIGVILGSESEEGRFQEMKGLMVWVFENWQWD